MASGEEQAAVRETVARDLNEEIEAAHEEAGREGYVPMLCECGKPDCAACRGGTGRRCRVFRVRLRSRPRRSRRDLDRRRHYSLNDPDTGRGESGRGRSLESR